MVTVGGKHNKETVAQTQEESSSLSLCCFEMHDIAAIMNEAMLPDRPQKGHVNEYVGVDNSTVKPIRKGLTTLSQFSNQNPSHSDPKVLQEIERYHPTEDNVNITSRQKRELYKLLKRYILRHEGVT
jgi:ribosomal 50S subunit-associated protein YjgA (DUF615 family)